MAAILSRPQWVNSCAYEMTTDKYGCDQANNGVYYTADISS